MLALALAKNCCCTLCSFGYRVMHKRLVDAQGSLANLANAPTKCFETPQKQWLSLLTLQHTICHVERGPLGSLSLAAAVDVALSLAVALAFALALALALVLTLIIE